MSVSAPVALERMTVSEMIAARVEETPDAVAVADGCEQLSYGALESRANRLANYLRGIGVERGSVVCVCLPRSSALLVSELAVLKAQGVYVPLDPADPAERLKHIAADSGAGVLLTSARLSASLDVAPQRVVAVDAETAIGSSSAKAPESSAGAEDLAYVIYTSGSTGRPKGVEITHGSLANLVRWHLSAFGVTAADRATHMAAVGFDASVWETWPYLAAGASVHLVPAAVRGDAAALRDWLIANGISIAFAATAVAERMMELEWPAGTALRWLLTGADTLRRYPPASLPFALVNNYGPTECTVVATSGRVPARAGASESPSIGRPILNTEILIVDERLQPVAADTPGEICIGGAGLARGYHNRADLTAEKFVPHPFSRVPGARLYRTGDRGRWLPSGEIAFLGRIDDQVKIRGYRVELNEVADALRQCAEIADAATTVREDGAGERQIVAYIVLKSGRALAADALRRALRARLPEYMIPAVFNVLEELPRSPHGKVDRAALLSASGARRLPESETPAEARAGTEAQVASLVCGLLQVDQVGADDNFFLLGGHSLLAAQLTVRLRQAFGVEVPLRELFESPTVAELAASIERRLAAPGTAATPAGPVQ